MKAFLIYVGSSGLLLSHLWSFKLRKIKELEMNQRIAVVLKLLSVVVMIAGFCFSSKPAATAQVSQPQQMITTADAVQDVQISQLQSQLSLDSSIIATLRDDLSALKGEMRGAYAAFGILQVLSIFFQLRKGKERV